MESSTTSQPNHPYSPVNRINLDMDFEENMFSQDYNYNQDYSMVYGSGHGSAHGNSMKTNGFWDAVIMYFEKETDSTRANHESGTNDLDVYHKACAEYKMIYKQDFTLEHCYNVLKDHQGWIQIEMPNFYTTQRQKSIDLNDEADEETGELRPMGRDRAKAKKKSVCSSRAGSSLFVDLLREAEVQQVAQLKREKLEIQRRTLELAERDKRDKDILFYNSEISSSLPPIQQQKLLEMKLEIKARYNLDY
ncbi:hypothetical protein Tco_0957162 [Tanacetum coccineum]